MGQKQMIIGKDSYYYISIHPHFKSQSTHYVNNRQLLVLTLCDVNGWSSTAVKISTTHEFVICSSQMFWDELNTILLLTYS
jgi:hypothetical protein